MSKRENDLLVKDILGCIERIEKYISGISFTQFVDDIKTQDAVIRNFSIIGEAATRFSEAFQKSNPAIQFKEMKAFRNRIIHDYSEVNYERIWDIIQLDLPHLKEELSKAKF